MSFTYPKTTTLVLAMAVSALSATAHAAPECELTRPVKFGGMNWESNLVLVDIERFIMEKGYGCKTETLPTETLPALTALVRGDLDINSEIWLNSVADPWVRAEKTGKVKRIGDIYMGGEGWFIPRYTAERFPELKAATDLPRFKDKFKNPEEPGKGRFYGCPAGWGCEVASTNLFRALGLGDTFSLYSPGTGAAQKAALTSAYKRKQDIVFYYWFPTPLVGALDLVKLELPPFDAEKHQCLTSTDCPNPQASGYPQNPVFTAVNTAFSQTAPQLTEFLSRVSIPLPVVDETLAHMESSGDDAQDVAKWFLKNKPDIWSQWVSADVAARVQSAL